jgi:hypothetical protein|tara:strand:+ start:509 stop:700 length:192 start_codon:yes stop_codon:yes gene_type:complete
MDKNQSLLLASVVFGVVALSHLVRSIFGWEFTISNFNVPLYFSYIAVVVVGYLSWHMYSANKK